MSSTGWGAGRETALYGTLEMSQRWVYRIMRHLEPAEQTEWRAVLAVRDDSGIAQAAADEEAYLGAQRMAHVREAYLAFIERLPELQSQAATERRADYEECLRLHRAREAEEFDPISLALARALSDQYQAELRAERTAEGAIREAQDAKSEALAEQLAAEDAAADAPPAQADGAAEGAPPPRKRPKLGCSRQQSGSAGGPAAGGPDTDDTAIRSAFARQDGAQGAHARFELTQLASQDNPEGDAAQRELDELDAAGLLYSDDEDGLKLPESRAEIAQRREEPAEGGITGRGASAQRLPAERMRNGVLERQVSTWRKLEASDGRRRPARLVRVGTTWVPAAEDDRCPAYTGPRCSMCRRTVCTCARGATQPEPELE